MNDGQRPANLDTRSWFDRLASVISGEAENKPELIDELRDANERGLFNQETLAILEGALAVSDMQVREVMIPRTQMIAIRADERPEEFLPRIIDSAHSRFPVLNEQPSEVVGILLAKDLLPFLISQDLEQFEIKEVARPVRRVPESKRLDQLLKDFRDNRAHMAVVIDEYGGTSGIITVEDIVEELFGEIEDEHDNYDYFEKKISENTYELSARLEIEYLNKSHNLNLPESETYDTLGGLIVFNVEEIPKVDDEIKIGQYSIKIIEASSSKIEKVLLKKIEQE